MQRELDDIFALMIVIICLNKYNFQYNYLLN